MDSGGKGKGGGAARSRSLVFSSFLPLPREIVWPPTFQSNAPSDRLSTCHPASASSHTPSCCSNRVSFASRRRAGLLRVSPIFSPPKANFRKTAPSHRSSWVRHFGSTLNRNSLSLLLHRHVSVPTCRRLCRRRRALGRYRLGCREGRSGRRSRCELVEVNSHVVPFNDPEPTLLGLGEVQRSGLALVQRSDDRDRRVGRRELLVLLQRFTQGLETVVDEGGKIG